MKTPLVAIVVDVKLREERKGKVFGWWVLVGFSVESC